MKKVLLTFLMLLLTMTINAQKTPILERDLFFGNPEISGGQLSPDGKWISFMKEYKGIMNIWVKKFDESFAQARPLTDSPRPLYGYFWTRDGKYILYVKDKDGDENINIFAVDPMAKTETGKVPESRNLTPMKDIRAQINMVSKKDPDLLYIGLNDRDKAWHDLYQLKVSTGKLTKVYENKDRVTGFDFDWDEKLRVLYKTDEKGTTTMYRIDEGNKLEPIYSTSVTEQAYIYTWNEDNSKAYLVTNKGDLNLSTLFLLDPKTKQLTKVESDPLNKVDFGGLNVSDITRKLISTSYTDEKTRIYWKDKKWEANYNYLKSKFPGREVEFQSSTLDEKKFLVAVWGDKYATEAYFFNTDNKELIHQYTPRPALKKVEQYLSPMKAIYYKSSDGMTIPAFLTIPVGTSGKNLPVVMLIHGGPKGPRDTWGYDSEAQFLANRGYAVLQPNFRASGGYGKNFLNAGDMQWGKLMQDDITWGVKHLVKEGIADPKRVAIMGGSYGGYATLAGLAFTPDLYAAGVDIVGPSNIFTLLDSIPAYWEAGKAMLYGMVGDPNTEAGKKRIKEASPLFSADKIVKPLLIIQGANDPRVKQAEADQIVIALRDKGAKVNYLLAKDEGHGFAKPLNKMAMYAETEKFLAETIGGRYQKEMSADVAKKLDELRVDVSKVKYEPKKEAKLETSLPKINNSLKEGVENFELAIEVQGQKIPMTMTRTTTKKGNNWSVKDVAKSPMGEMIDEVEFANDFTAISRTLNQMGQTIPMSYSKDKVNIEMMGKKMEIPFKGAYMVDGPGYDAIIAGLPLSKGYSFSFQTADVMSMKAKSNTLTVIGEEEMNGAKYQKVEVVNNDNAAEKQTLWINPTTKKADKIVSVIPAMGNAVMTMTRK
ncbi:MAG: S9 family peptidase [Cloacibacterium sp.]|nr:S9 family peptidase [Cloacibacterium sp.]